MKIEHLVWLRNDLRVLDNPALYHASLQGNVAVLFTLTQAQWQKHNESDAKTGLRLGLMENLATKLAQLGIPVHFIVVDYFTELAEEISKLCKQLGVQGFWFNQELALDEANRDKSVQQALVKHNITCYPQMADLIVAQAVLSQQNTPFKVFTPFFKRWLSLLSQQSPTPLPAPTQQGNALSVKPIPKLANYTFRDDLWPADLTIAQQKLWQFCHHKERHYDKERDFPALPATSTLSPYLALGALGPRQCLEAIHHICGREDRAWQDSTWLKELAWRDFYRQLMHHFPNLNKGLPFKPETSALIWQDDDQSFQAWCQGNTGFPIVDAAMRQLNQTGWMHNRLRMITASFFCKLLFADWRKGEAYFMRQLIDGEFAANNGGWQWSASTGCDAAPYFRVFNPTRQSESYDKNGDFIRRFVPELAKLDSKSIHNPNSQQRKDCHYPTPIIDYKPARLAAIAAFDNLKERA
ncbi:deoxyribodipyrimidine photo-lyase [Marinomonas sp. THO17]|uniref:deoxyribodipyrimidine photo-lyase n=1 Tax=Marinomonas sp. THO17 TaxID=3149048 RepID=UPI00336BF43F